VSPIATRSFRAEKLTIGEALRRLGRFWWVWIVLGQWSAYSSGGVTPWPIYAMDTALGLWGIVVLSQLAAALPAPWASRLRWVVALAAATLLAEVVLTFAFGAPGVAKDVGFFGVSLAFTGYIVVLGGFCAAHSAPVEVVGVWKRSLRWVGVTAGGAAIAVAFGSLVVLSHRTAGVTPWKIGFGIGAVIFAVSSVGALLMTARATALTRQGLEPRLA
jgi:hypothetical protein